MEDYAGGVTVPHPVYLLWKISKSSTAEKLEIWPIAKISITFSKVYINI